MPRGGSVVWASRRSAVGGRRARTAPPTPFGAGGAAGRFGGSVLTGRTAFARATGERREAAVRHHRYGQRAAAPDDVRLAHQARRTVRQGLHQPAARAQPQRYVDRAGRARERAAEEPPAVGGAPGEDRRAARITGQQPGLLPAGGKLLQIAAGLGPRVVRLRGAGGSGSRTRTGRSGPAHPRPRRRSGGTGGGRRPG